MISINKINLILLCFFVALVSSVAFFSLNFVSFSKRHLSGLYVDGDSKVNFLSGSASNVSYVLRGYPLPLGKVAWNFDVFEMLSLKLCMRFSSISDVSQAKGRICYKVFDRAFLIEETHFSVSAAEIAEVSGIMIDGYFQGKLDRLDIDSKGINHVLSDIAWLNPKFFNGDRWLNLSDIQIEAISPNPKNIVVQWSDYQAGQSLPKNSPNIDIYMQAIFEHNRLVRVQGLIEPISDYDVDLLDTLQLIATPMTDGSYRIEYQR